MMNIHERILLFQIAELGEPNFAEISIATHHPTDYLNHALANLTLRGFLEHKGNRYTVPRYVLDELIPKEERCN